MNNLKIFGKFLDQPILISKLNKAAPAILTMGGAAILANNAIDTFQKSQDKKQAKKDILKNSKVIESRILPLACKTLEDLASPTLSPASLLLSLSVSAAVPSLSFFQHTKCALALGIHTHSSISPEQRCTCLKYHHFQ